MNYYEFAPPILRWFMNPETKPWEMFKTFWIILVLAMIALLVLGWYYQKKKPKQTLGHIAFYGVWIVLLYHVIIADKHYLDYEFEKACQTAGIYITKQVEADGYAESTGSPILSVDELKTLKDLKGEKSDYSVWETLDEEQCENPNPAYLFREKISLHRLNSGELYFHERWEHSDKILDEKGKSKSHYYVSSYFGEKDGKCVRGYLPKPLSRYFVIEEESRRVGLGLRQYEEYIVDTQTGEKIASTVRFTTAANLLATQTIGRFGELTNYCDKDEIKSSNANTLKHYRETKLRSPIFKMINLTLIPKRYFQGNDQ